MRGVIRSQRFARKHIVCLQLAPVPFNFSQSANLAKLTSILSEHAPGCRSDSEDKNSWKVPDRYWPSIQEALRSSGFRVLSDVESIRHPRRDSGEVAALALFASLWLLVELGVDLLEHLTGSTVHHRHSLGEQAFSIRLWFTLSLSFLTFVAVRFGKLINLIVAGTLLVFVNPLHPFYFSNWWLWFFSYLGVALYAIVGGMLAVGWAGEEKSSENWWTWCHASN